MAKPVKSLFKYRDWRDFTEKVCVPIVESNDNNEAMTEEFVSMDPYYLAVCLVIANNTVKRLEAEHGK